MIHRLVPPPSHQYTACCNSRVVDGCDQHEIFLKGQRMHGSKKPASFLLLAIVFVWLATVAGPAQAQDDKAKEAEAAKLGVEAVVYGFPLVIVDVTKRLQTNVEEPNNNGQAPVNQFSNFLKYPNA